MIWCRIVGLVTHYFRFVIILLFASSCGMSAWIVKECFQISVKIEDFSLIFSRLVLLLLKTTKTMIKAWNFFQVDSWYFELKFHLVVFPSMNDSRLQRYNSKMKDHYQSIRKIVTRLILSNILVDQYLKAWVVFLKSCMAMKT